MKKEIKKLTESESYKKEIPRKYNETRDSKWKSILINLDCNLFFISLSWILVRSPEYSAINANEFKHLLEKYSVNPREYFGKLLFFTSSIACFCWYSLSFSLPFYPNSWCRLFCFELVRCGVSIFDRFL